MLKRLLAVFAVALLTLATYAVAQELRPDHPRTYVVRKGATLWDIAARFLTKHWLRPYIWTDTPQIANTPRNYPGDSCGEEQWTAMTSPYISHMVVAVQLQKKQK